MSNALLHLIPNALEIDPRDDFSNYIKFLYALVGVYSFLILEITLKTIFSWARRKPVPSLDTHCLHEHSSHFPEVETHTPVETENPQKKESNTKPFYQPVFMSGMVSSSAFLILLGDSIHNFIDGLIIGSSFAVSFRNGLTVSTAILFEEFAHELGDFAALLNSGMTKYQAVFWNLVATITNLIGSLIGVRIAVNTLVVSAIESYCGGMFLYISLVVMLPDVMSKVTHQSKGEKKEYIRRVFNSLFGILLGISIMVLMAFIPPYFFNSKDK
ncbi:Zinc transporter ZIP14 [Thelohanellus kitauei]|uniref:Zinc transporter ZIP14 n=1 Tax=Thelohanellus kitauei TaxID=669202 RepID=A0A0C2J686_THEKT|nr:Zinc transporter ZIP14 [Thelohanellus kitauei]